MKISGHTRASLIAEGCKILPTNGYDGVGLAEILNSVGVPKGSFYYFFKSKEDFALAVLDDYEQKYIALRHSILDNESRSPLQRIFSYFDELERIHLAESPLGGCLYGVLAQTIAGRTPEFRERLATVFYTWDAHFERILAEAQAVGEVDPELDPKATAAFLIDAYEGALIRMKAEGGSAAFQRFRTFVLSPLSWIGQDRPRNRPSSSTKLGRPDSRSRTDPLS